MRLVSFAQFDVTPGGRFTGGVSFLMIRSRVVASSRGSVMSPSSSRSGSCAGGDAGHHGAGRDDDDQSFAAI